MAEPKRGRPKLPVNEKRRTGAFQLSPALLLGLQYASTFQKEQGKPSSKSMLLEKAALGWKEERELLMRFYKQAIQDLGLKH